MSSEDRPESAAVVVVTYERPDYVATCLDHLRKQSRSADEVVVVDSSRDDRTEELVATYPEVVYVRNPNGYGHMTQSRNLGYRATVSEIVAYIDDDAFAHEDWLDNLLDGYDDPAVGAVGGRARNGQPGESAEGRDRVGRLLPNGELTGFFAADTGATIDVDHLIGCNMSYRRRVLDDLGGFREDFPGTALREDTDMSLRVKAAGHRLRYVPTAVVDHVAAPHARGRRFDIRYSYYGHRNHAVLLIRNFGLRRPFARYVGSATRREAMAFTRRAGSATLRLATFAGGTAVGIVDGVRLRRTDDRARR